MKSNSVTTTDIQPTDATPVIGSTPAAGSTPVADSARWYALKVYFNRGAAIASQLQQRTAGAQVYQQQVVPNLLFVKCTAEQILAIRQEYWQQLFVYFNPERTEPYAIPENQMTAFILVTSNGADGLQYLGDDKAEYHQGDHVRVIGGVFNGAQGYIRRIKRDRKLVVSINGIAAVAVANIREQFLEKIE